MIATIDASAEVFTLINTFHTSTDRQEAIVRSLSAFTRDVARHLPGFVGSSVHVSLDGARVVNYVQWRSHADLQAMLATPEVKAHMAEVAGFADRIDPVPYRVTAVDAVR